MRLLRFSQGISSGYHHATPTPYNFFDLSLLWEEALICCFDLANVFLGGATTPPLHPRIFYFQYVIV
jgi:hypothetical protein